MNAKVFLEKISNPIKVELLKMNPGQLQPVMPVCGAPQVNVGNFNGANKTCGLTPVRSTVPQVSLGGYNGVSNNLRNYTLPMPTNYGGMNGMNYNGGIQLPTNYQTTPLPNNAGYLTPRGGNYSPRIELGNQPVATSPSRDNFFKWLFSF